MVNFNVYPLLAALPFNGIFNSMQAGSGTQRSLREPPEVLGGENDALQREAFLDALVANMTLPELGGSFFHPIDFTLF